MKIIKYVCLVITIVLNCYLIYHSTLPGEVSSSKSETVTDSVVHVIDKVNPSNDSIIKKYGKNTKRIAYISDCRVFYCSSLCNNNLLK